MNQLTTLSETMNCQSSAMFSDSGLDEFSFILTSDPSGEFSEQCGIMSHHLAHALAANGLSDDSIVYCRFFLDNPLQQMDQLRRSPLVNHVAGACYSVVGQPPLGGGHLAMYVYCLRGDSLKKTVLAQNETDGYSAIRLMTGHHEFLWVGGLMSADAPGSYAQTHDIFSRYTALADSYGFSLNPDTIRTWIFVKDVDNNYGGMVDARRQHFETHELTKETHYIASTGIEADLPRDGALVALDAVASRTLRPDQVSFMQAPQNMCPTHLYNVTFERGTRIRYGDRNHMYISGTASIDTKGEVMYIDDITAQTHRTLDNIQSLLEPQGASLSDLTYIVVYLRRRNEYDHVRQVLENRLPDAIPRLYTLAPVCRPTWLVEIEGVAVTAENSPHPNL